MAKIYMALLGTSNYEEMTYRYDGLERKTCYVQEALLDMLKQKGEIFDRIVFFLTEQAREKHWKELRSRILRLYPDEHVITVIPIQNNESRAGLLDMFNTMYSAMEQQDCVTFDITHSFRSMPALFFPLMSYAKEMKQITVHHIFYGPYDSATKSSNVIDLKIYESIMTCSNAAHNFIRSGNAKEILETIRSQQNSMPGNERIIFNNTKSAAENLSKLSNCLLLCLSGNHGKNCISHYAKRVRTRIKMLYEQQNSRQSDEMSDYEKEAAFFDELIDHVYESVREVSAEQPLSSEGLAAVRWYIGKEHVMQAYSALRETIITFLCETYAPEKDCLERDVRDAIEKALYALTEKSKGRKAKLSASQFSLMNEAYRPLFFKVYNHIEPESVIFVSDLLIRRNVMDHFGMNKDTDAEPDLDFLKGCFDKALALFESIESRKDQILTDEQAEQQILAERTGVFVNFSNHPVENWDAAQKQAAAEQCGTDRIVDVPFPLVSPDLNTDEIRQLAEEYLKQITDLKPGAVMCMGEFGLCYYVVNELKKRRIPVVYSCTERESHEKATADGIEKTSVFRFRRFRNY